MKPTNFSEQIVVWGLCILSWVGLAGCSTPVAVHPDSDNHFSRHLGEFYDMPRSRTGSLPFPGPFTLYEEADPSQLGRHSYSGQTPDGAQKECDRGIVYTRAAGFLDICHVRNAADMTAYIHARVKLALQRGWKQAEFRAHEPSMYTITLQYPRDWATMPAGEREALIAELSVVIAQRVAFDVMTWHELLTWYGYKSTVLISEKGSAFTHEDIASHALGVQLAADAIRQGGDYDARITNGLNESMHELRVVGKAELDEAQELVRDKWWSKIGGAKQRMLDIGLADGRIEPWAIDQLREGCELKVFTLPSLERIAGRDCSGMYLLEIDPKVLEGFAIRNVLEGDPDRIIPERHFAVLLGEIAEDTDQPLDAMGEPLPPQLAARRR